MTEPRDHQIILKGGRPNAPLTTAYCWATGLIEFCEGDKVPEGTCPIVTTNFTLDELKAAVAVKARHGYNGELLVPGVPEAPRQSVEALDALARWKNWAFGPSAFFSTAVGGH